jgi:hypothetical protein
MVEEGERMKPIIFFMMIFLGTACGLSNWDEINQEAASLYILSIDPASESSVTTLSQVELIFSKPLAIETVTPQTLFVITLADYELYEQDWDDLHDEVVDSDVTTIPCTLEWSDGNQKVNLTLTQDLEADTEYVVVALPLIQAFDYMPLDQTIVGFVTKQFSSSFLMVSETTSVNDTESMSESETSSSESDDGSSTQTDSVEASYPEVSSEEMATENSLSEETEESFDWQKVLITEVVPDPQQDHSESSAGDGILFNETPGTGSVSSSDEYIEIFNGTEESLNMIS